MHLASTSPRNLGERSGYLAPSLKNPANGKIVFTEDDFIDLADPLDLQRVLDGEGICKGLVVQ